MAGIDFSRAEEGNITIDLDMKFDGVIDITRSDEAAVDFSGKTIKMDIYKDRDDANPKITLTSGSEITVATNRLTFDNTFTTLDERSYYYRLYNDTDKVAIRRGLLVVE